VLLPFKTSLEILDPSDAAPRKLSKKDLDPTNATSKKLSKVDLDPTNAFVAPPTMADPSSPRVPMIYTPPVESEPEPEPPAPCEQVKEHLVGYEEHVDTRSASTTFLPIPDPTAVRLISNKRLTPDTHWQDVRELTFLIPAECEYEAGQTITIYPRNFPEDVQTLIDLQEWNHVADKVVRVKAEHPRWYLDQRLMETNADSDELYALEDTTFRELLTHNLDFTAIPKRHFFSMIAMYTDDPVHKERLSEFADQAFTEEFFDYTTRPRRSILEVLQDFPTVKIPWTYATSFFPVIRGREYSIATGGTQRSYYEDRRFIKLQIIVALVKYRTVLRKIRQGLCSRYIASLKGGTKMNVTFNASEKFYQLAGRNPELPLILIAPGTGLAPCRSLIWTREELHLGSDSEVGRSYLFYGGRNKNADFFYSHEWKQNALQVEVFTAFSRDQPEKIYVQDIIREEGQMIEYLIREEGAIIYVCGSSGKMPLAVREALIDVCTEFNPHKLSRERIQSHFEALERHGHYVQETW
jgi:sulfite reductase alpha subunit-like flavoprotein